MIRRAFLAALAHFLERRSAAPAIGPALTRPRNRRERRSRASTKHSKPRRMSKLARRCLRSVRVPAPESTRRRPNSRQKRRARWLAELARQAAAGGA
jgi:hypothetical protein